MRRFLCMIGLHEYKWEAWEYTSKRFDWFGTCVSKEDVTGSCGTCQHCGFQKVKPL